jgi:putative hydrolase of the HAD superfamily
MKAAIFDLDNTLYPESQFVEGGFRAAASHLAARHDVPTAEAYECFVAALKEGGRCGVFDRAVARLGVSCDPLSLVYAYRTHAPNLALFPDAIQALAALRDGDWMLAVLTDGMGSVQRRKLAALGLDACVPPVLEAIVVTDEIGPGAAKPARLGFDLALDLLGVRPLDAAYVGDDAAKDFLAPNDMGMLTIMIERDVRWPYSGTAPTAQYEARHVVSNLLEAASILGRHS